MQFFGTFFLNFLAYMTKKQYLCNRFVTLYKLNQQNTNKLLTKTINL